jgi:hypothetical protein
MNRARLIGALLLLAVAPVQSALGGDRIFLSGAEASRNDYYTYIGTVIPGPGWQNGKGFFQRYWLDRFGYEYEAGVRDIQARAWGGEAALGYVNPTSRGWWSASVGLKYSDTNLSPDDRAASARGAQISPKVQLEADTQLAPAWRLAAIASYTFDQSQYWGRMRATRRLSSRWSAGGELTVNGNDEFDSIGTGIVGVWQPDSSLWSLALKTGYRFQDGDDGVFVGMEIGRSF